MGTGPARRNPVLIGRNSSNPWRFRPEVDGNHPVLAQLPRNLGVSERRLAALGISLQCRLVAFPYACRRRRRYCPHRRHKNCVCRRRRRRGRILRTCRRHRRRHRRRYCAHPPHQHRPLRRRRRARMSSSPSPSSPILRASSHHSRRGRRGRGRGRHRPLCARTAAVTAESVLKSPAPLLENGGVSLERRKVRNCVRLANWSEQGLQMARISQRKRKQHCPQAWNCTFAPW